MKKLWMNHGLLLGYLATLLLGVAFHASEPFFIGVALGGVFFVTYDKLHDILMVLRSQPQISGCVINAHRMEYTPTNAITNVFSSAKGKDAADAQPEQQQ
ncbi:hypothetical protein [Castellaniella sp.]|uniref:hypothetical protein n=1 Tax=Castellaniella sp. TaxID=1955812 RepID=UPI002AFF5FE1|nr:hypothetical protein [Castellaniella sp.]